MSGTDEEFSDTEIQNFENDLLGFYVTSHPLSSIKDNLPFLTTHIFLNFQIRRRLLCYDMRIDQQLKLITTKSNKLLKVGSIEDLTGNVEFVAYSEVLNKYNSILESRSKVIIGGKIQHRGDEDVTISIIINDVSAVDNCNIVNIYLEEESKFEDLMALKDLLIQYKGSDPVIFNVGNNGNSVKILSSSGFWIQSSNDIQHLVKNKFSSVKEMTICSLDAANS